MELITTTRIKEAKYAIKNTFLDLVIADIRLTGILRLDGLELLSYIQEKSPGTKVIIMTAHCSPELEKEVYQKGSYFCFEKPIDLRSLNEVVTKATSEQTVRVVNV